MSLSLGVFLIFIRTDLVNFSYLHSALLAAPRVALAGYYDLAYVAVIAAVFLGLLWIARRNATARRILVRVFLGIALFSLLFGLVNIKIVPMLGRPLTYRWLYYADFLDSQDARNAIVAELSMRVVAIAAACLAGFLGAASVLRRALRFSANRVGSRPLTIVGIGTSLVYFLLGGIWLHARDWNYQSLANPVFAFASSVLTNSRPPSLLTMETSLGFDDFEPPRPIPILATPDRGVGANPQRRRLRA